MVDLLCGAVGMWGIRGNETSFNRQRCTLRALWNAMAKFLEKYIYPERIPFVRQESSRLCKMLLVRLFHVLPISESFSDLQC